MASTEQDGLAASILKPGSSLSPEFLSILDGAFIALLVVFVALVFVTSGSLHIFALIVIELALWASVKWFVLELKESQNQLENEEKKDQ